MEIEKRANYRVSLNVNGKLATVVIDPRVTLLDALRDHLGLTGTKKGCDHGQCGACTVLLEGRGIKSCMTLAVMHDGAAITTVEGLAKNGVLSRLQRLSSSTTPFSAGSAPQDS